MKSTECLLQKLYREYSQSENESEREYVEAIRLFRLELFNLEVILSFFKHRYDDVAAKEYDGTSSDMDEEEFKAEEKQTKGPTVIESQAYDESDSDEEKSRVPDQDNYQEMRSKTDFIKKRRDVQVPVKKLNKLP